MSRRLFLSGTSSGSLLYSAFLPRCCFQCRPLSFDRCCDRRRSSDGWIRWTCCREHLLWWKGLTRWTVFLIRCICVCNWDDVGNTTTGRHLDANYTFPICLGKGDAQGDRIHQSGTLKVAVQGIRMVVLAPNYRHNALLAAIAVSSASLALSAVASFAGGGWGGCSGASTASIWSNRIRFVPCRAGGAAGFSAGDDVEDVTPVVLRRALQEGLVPIRAAASSIVPVKVGKTCLGSAIVAILDVWFLWFCYWFLAMEGVVVMSEGSFLLWQVT